MAKVAFPQSAQALGDSLPPTFGSHSSHRAWLCHLSLCGRGECLPRGRCFFGDAAPPPESQARIAPRPVTNVLADFFSAAMHNNCSQGAKPSKRHGTFAGGAIGHFPDILWYRQITLWPGPRTSWFCWHSQSWCPGVRPGPRSSQPPPVPGVSVHSLCVRTPFP